MILYLYSYENYKNQIIITPVEVKETEKLYKTVDRKSELIDYKSQILKSELDTVQRCIHSSMVSLSPDKTTEFIEKMIEIKQNNMQHYKEKVLNSEIQIKKLTQVKIHDKIN